MPVLLDRPLTELTQAKLIALVLKLVNTVKRLEAEVGALREELEQSKKPPTSSSNSSQPPSRDWKAERPQRNTPWWTIPRK